MIKCKKKGIVLILIGLCFPLIMFLLATKINILTEKEALAHLAGYSTSGDIVDTIQNLEIVLRKQSIIDLDDAKSKVTSKIAIPYKYILTSGILCLFTGVGFLLLRHKPTESNSTG